MNRIKVKIELFEEHENVNFYTIVFPNKESETEKFFEKFPLGSEYDEDIDIILEWIDIIGEKGALERYFRPEGKMKDSLGAIPLDSSNLRLFCLRIRDNIVILGNGDVKKTLKYEDDDLLRCYAETLQSIDYSLKQSIKNKKTYLFKKDIFGKITFNLDKDCSDEEK